MELATSIWTVYWTLVKILVPVLVAVKILDSFGATQGLALIFSPVMSLVGLPGTMAIVLATSVLTNVFAGVVVFLSLASTTPLTGAEITVLSSMMLLAHSLPVEGAIARAVGIPWSVILALRIGGAFILGLILHYFYQYTNTMQSTSVILWQPEVTDSGFNSWLLSQIETLLILLMILTMLISLLKMLKFMGAEKWIHFVLAPFLKLLGLGKESSDIVVIGVMLGLSFGGGLLIQEARSGNISKRDIFLSMSFICVCHSLIEDTIVVLLLGPDIVGVLWIRIVFAFVLIAIVARLPLNLGSLVIPPKK